MFLTSKPEKKFFYPMFMMVHIFSEQFQNKSILREWLLNRLATSFLLW